MDICIPQMDLLPIMKVESSEIGCDYSYIRRWGRDKHINNKYCMLLEFIHSQQINKDRLIN